MLSKSLTYVILLCSLGSVASAYSLDGYWDMTPTRLGQYQTIKQMVTFQFKREVDSGGKIVSYLYVYNCFLAKFLYEISEREIWFNFKTSSILSQNCSIAQISQLRNLLQKVFFYQIRYDQLSLLDPRGTAVFSMAREKIDYKNVLVGIWDLFTNKERAATLTYINGTDIYMCRDLSTFSYNLTTNNGSYPQLTVRKGISGPCNDMVFVNGISKAAFFQVSENRSQLLVFDRNGKYILTMNQAGSIKANLKLASDPSPPQPKIPIIQDNSKFVTNKPTIAVTISSNSQSKPSNVVTQTSKTTQSSSQTEPTTPRYQSQQPGKASLTVQSATQASSQLVQPVKPVPSTQPVVQTPSTPQIQTSDSSSPFTFTNFDQPSQFSNSFNFDPGFNNAFPPQPTLDQSFVDPVPYGTIPLNNIQPTPTNPPITAPSIEPTKTNQVLPNPTPIEVQQPVQNDDFAGEFSFVYQDQSFNADSFSNQGQPQLLIPVSSSSDSQTNQNLQTNISNEIPLPEFIQQNKWLINWLNGLNVVPKHLRRVYLVFTSTKIILYCPCNTYYTGYQLQGNLLKGLQWMGTQNQCDNNRDSELTNYIFYSNRIKANGNNLVFYFSTQVKAAEFQPYF